MCVCIFIERYNRHYVCIHVFVHVGVLSFPCTMRPVYPHEHTFAYNKNSHKHAPRSLTPSLGLCSHTLANSHSQIQLPNFLHKISIHTHICYDFMTRKNFPDPLFISRQRSRRMQHRIALVYFLWKWKTNRESKYTHLAYTHIFEKVDFGLIFARVSVCVWIK